VTILKPFRSIRPTKELASKVAAPPYDVMNSLEAKEIAKDNPYSFLHIDRAEIDLDSDIELDDKRVYEKAGENLRYMIEKEILIQDKRKKLYIYQQTMNDKSQTGIVGCLSVDDYMDNKIKKHENTIEDKEKDRTNHVYYCNAHTGPIFLTYRSKDNIKNIMNEWISKNSPIYDFTSEDGVNHRAWTIDDDEVINSLIGLVGEIDSLYIADGHHRAASAVAVVKMKGKDNPNYTGEEEFNYFLGVLFSDEELNIMDYNRAVKDLNGYRETQIIEKLKDKFQIEKIKDNQPYKPENKHQFGMYLENQWYKLKAKEDSFDGKDRIESLDVSILQNNILEPILGIEDPRTSSRIDFIGGIRGLEELEKRVANDMAIAFSLYPTSIEDLMAIADEGKTMPPKSTWFEPKLRSGLFVHDLKSF